MSKDQIICPVCEMGELVIKKGPSSFCYKGYDFSFEDIEYCECPSCHYEVILPEQSERNEARIRDEHRKIDGLLTSAEIIQLRKRFNISQSQAAQIFSDSTNAFSNFEQVEKGEITQSLGMDKLMKLALRVPHCFDELCKMAKQAQGQCH